MPGRWVVFTEPFDWQPRPRVMVSKQPGIQFVVAKLADEAVAKGKAREATEEEATEARARRDTPSPVSERQAARLERLVGTEPAEIIGKVPKRK